MIVAMNSSRTKSRSRLMSLARKPPLSWATDLKLKFGTNQKIITAGKWTTVCSSLNKVHKDQDETDRHTRNCLARSNNAFLIWLKNMNLCNKPAGWPLQNATHTLIARDYRSGTSSCFIFWQIVNKLTRVAQSRRISNILFNNYI